MNSKSLFSLDEHLARLCQADDSLETLDAVVDFESFCCDNMGMQLMPEYACSSICFPSVLRKDGRTKQIDNSA